MSSLFSDDEQEVGERDRLNEKMMMKNPLRARDDGGDVSFSLHPFSASSV